MWESRIYNNKCRRKYAMTDYVETMRKILKENGIIVFQGEEDEVLDTD